MVTKEEILEMKRTLARIEERKEKPKKDYLRSLENRIAELRETEEEDRKQAKKMKKDNEQEPVFIKASTSLPYSLYDGLKQKAKADGMSYSDALKILAHRYVAGVIELDKNDSKLVDRYYKP